jgi:hypothetical protein
MNTRCGVLSSLGEHFRLHYVIFCLLTFYNALACSCHEYYVLSMYS